MDISQVITDFVAASVKQQKVAHGDQVYLKNRILHLLKLASLEARTESSPLPSLLESMDNIVIYGKTHGAIQHLFEQEQLESDLMDLITPLPSIVNAHFWQNYQQNPQLATDYFYHLCLENDYIKTRAIAKNIAYTVATDYGDLEITINLSKPEKNPEQLALASKMEKTDYPPCLLCLENEGYAGRANHPARSNHRIIRLQLNKEEWGMQYSPYAYYAEHSIFLSSSHRPMQINRETFGRLTRITELFPHYFVGSNADLPIVGGSILTHDHYQGGKHVFAMTNAAPLCYFKLPDFPQIKASIIKWPMSVIRLQSSTQTDLVDAATHILTKWQTYSDPQMDILAQSDRELHNTITPIARRRGEHFEMDLVLRNNRTTAKFPEGIFHPHRDKHHIKKENIGLIEVMGLAVLPPRLKPELEQVAAYLLTEQNEIKDYHRSWAEQMKASYTITKENVNTIIKEEVGRVFLQVLLDAAVFKPDQAGLVAFKRFIAEL